MNISPLASDADARACAQMMCTSEPWVTLGRTYEESLAILREPTREVYVARDGDAIRGFLILNMHGPFAGYIQTICIAADARGSGLGTQIIAFAEERIFKVSPNVFLCVSSFNDRARALYERLGYEFIGVLKSYLVTGHDELLYRKTIGPLRSFVKKE